MVAPNEYMYSLGPEKLFGNFLLGNLESICAIVSTGRYIFPPFFLFVISKIEAEVFSLEPTMENI